MMNVDSTKRRSLVHVAEVVLWRNDLSPAALEGLRNECSHPVSTLLRGLNQCLHLLGILRPKVRRGAVLVVVLPSVRVRAGRLHRNPTVVTLGQYSQWSLLVITIHLLFLIVLIFNINMAIYFCINHSLFMPNI